MRVVPLPSRTSRYAAALAIVAMLAGGCSLFSSTPAPDAAAKLLADGLTAADLSAVPLTGTDAATATAFYTQAFGVLKSAPRTVSVGSVTPKADDPTRATAVLTWTWDVSSAPTDWTYSTNATMRLAEDKTWQVEWAPSILEPKLVGTEKLTIDRAQGPRGEITGADGVVLMGLRDVYRVGLDKAKLTAGQAASSAAALATLLGIDPAGYAKTVAASGSKQFVVALTVRVDDPRIAGKTAAVQAIPGASALPDQAVLAPSATFARALLGTVGPATAELVEKSGGQIAPTDNVGQSGLQRQYDGWLGGVPGLTIRAVGTDTAGKPSARVLFTQPAQPGRPIATTLDVDAQTAAETALGGISEIPAALVALRPSTGEVLAAANSPGSKGLSTATTGRAAPGSTFKVVSALALLRGGLTPETLVPCTPTVTVDGRAFKNYDDYPAERLGQIPLRMALANSCNTAFISQAAKITQDDLADAAAALGIGVDFSFGTPSFFGSVPRAASGTEHAASMIGQGQVEASALTMAIVVASVAHGAAVVPKLVDRVPGMVPGASGDPTSAATTSGSGGATSSATATSLPTVPPPPAKPLTDAEAQALRSMLAAVVTDGSGRSLAGLGVGGAKTGTAEYGQTGATRAHVWMIAFRGDLAVAVFVQDGESGAKTAAPLVRAFLERFTG